MSIKKYINELKRRNVFKAAIAYLIIAWLILQVASIVLPAFDAPPYILKIILFVLSIGFFIWIIFSWTYDITEEGLKKTSSLKNSNAPKTQTGNRLSKVIIAGLSLIVIVLLISQFTDKESTTSLKETHLAKNVSNAKKMAVLPFLNTKPDTNSDYLGFALADQIIGGLVYVNAINIRPSSSIRKYEKTASNPATIGNELDVEYILVGNYLMVNDVIRLNIELVNTTTNTIILHEPLQLNFKSAFELQDIVSKKIIDKLKLHFEPNEQKRIRKNIPSNTLAYEYYLKAVSYSTNIDGSTLSVRMLEKSIELDSTYAPAYSLLASRTHGLANYGLKGSKEVEKAEELYLKALSLNDELINAYYGLSVIYTETGRTKKSFEAIKKILEINPNDSQAHKSLGYMYRYAGFAEESIEEMKKAEALDINNITTIGTSYISNGQYEEAYTSFEPTNRKIKTSLGYGFQGMIRYRQGKEKEALTLFKKVHEVDPNSLNDLWANTYISLIEGNKKNGLIAARKFEEYNISDSEAWFHFGISYALLGDKESSLRCLKRAIDTGYYNYSYLINEPLLDSLRNNEEFKKLVSITKKKHLDFKEMLSL